MSYVTGVVLCSAHETPVGGDEDNNGECWERVQAWLTEHDFAPLAVVDASFSGTKDPQMRVGGGGYNYFQHEEFAAFVIGLPWERPEQVVLVMTVEEYTSTVHRPHPFNSGFSVGPRFDVSGDPDN